MTAVTERFLVETALVDMTVTVDEGMLRSIEFGPHTTAPPTSRLARELSCQLTNYASGKRQSFEIPTSPAGSDFERSVWELIARIPWGETTTYGDIAAELGDPGLARAVGMATGRNPIPIVIPCHRVVAAGGGLGGFAGGLELKRKLLNLETTLSSFTA